MSADRSATASGRRRRGLSGPAGTAGLRLSECVLGLVAVVLAAGAFGTFYAGLRWLPWLAGTAIVGGGVVALCLLRNLRWWTTAVVVSVVVLALAHTAGYTSSSWFGLPTPASLRALGTGLWTGMPKTLTVGLPADFDTDLVVLPIVLAGAAGAATVTLLLRTRRVTPVGLPAVLLFVLGVAFTASRGGNGVLLAGTLVVVLLVLMLLRSNRVSVADDEGISTSDADAVGVDLAVRRRRSMNGRVALGLPVVAVVGGLAVAGTWLLPFADGRTRVDPRALYTPPFVLSAVLSPLVEVRPQLLGTDRPLFTVTVHGDTSPPLDRVRVAALDTFNGALWTRARTFQVTGTTLPDAPPVPGGTTVRLDVSVEHLDQPFLPVAGEPVRFDGSDFAFDRSTGTIVSTRKDVTGFSYVTTVEMRSRDQAMIDARPSRTAADDRFVQLPEGTPPWVGQLLTEVIGSRAGDRSTDVGRLIAIEDFLRSQQYSREALPGHSYGALYRTLLGRPADRFGGAEQFASAFAVLARAAGYPSRVAVGYRLSTAERDGDAFLVSTNDAHAWPEVHLQGYGWVPFEPTDTDKDVTPPPRSDDVTLDAADAAAAAAAAAAGSAGDRGDQPQRGVAARAGLVAAGIAAGAALLLVLPVLIKWLRRRRRAHHGPPAQRIIGAWREVVDRLVEAGVGVRMSQTGGEVARDLRGGPAAPVARHVADIAPLVAGAVFAFDEPDEGSAQRAWDLERRIGRDLAKALPMIVRLRGLIDPRPLLPRRRRAARRRARTTLRADGRTRAGVRR
jgi:hypothetical protein